MRLSTQCVPIDRTQGLVCAVTEPSNAVEDFSSAQLHDQKSFRSCM
jgi:hypothetical protein